MGWFKKEKVIDFSGLRRDIPKKPDYVQLEEKQKEDSSSGLGFLGNLASSAEPSSNLGEIENLHVKDLKVKIEDINYKLDSFSKRLSSVMDRVDLLEKKLDRDLRRTG